MADVFQQQGNISVAQSLYHQVSLTLFLSYFCYLLATDVIVLRLYCTFTADCVSKLNIAQ